MLEKQDMSQMQEYILQVLPQLLQQNPKIATTIEGMLAHQFPPRDEFIQLLNEVKLLREDTNRRFEQVDQRFEQVERRIELLQTEMNQRFEQVEKRIDLLHAEMNQRFEQVEQRIELLQNEVKLLREDTNQRFEEMEKRFEKRIELLQTEMNRRFEKMEKRFEKRFELLQEEMNRRFEEEKRERLDIKRRLIKVESMVTRMDEKITQFDAWLKLVTGNVGDKRGQEAEQLFALGLRYGLKRSDIKPETIQLRCQFMDEEGIVFPKKGKFIEVDIMAEDGKLSVFEVKITAVDTDVMTFARKVQLIQHQTPDKQVSGIFISPEASEAVKQCCAEYDLTFVG
jgi:hypothetical protein